jgi:hypothetical protein
LMSTLLMIVYLLMFFKQFKDHDYYFLPIVPYFFILCCIVLNGLFDKFKSSVVRVLITLVVFGIAIAGFNYTELNVYRRFTNSLDKFSKPSYQLRGADKFLDSLQVPRNSRMFVVGDHTMNGSLVMMNRFGWTFYEFPADLGKITNKEAEYLVILEPSQHAVPETLKKRLRDCRKYNYFGNLIYALN